MMISRQKPSWWSQLFLKWVYSMLQELFMHHSVIWGRTHSWCGISPESVWMSACVWCSDGQTHFCLDVFLNRGHCSSHLKQSSSVCLRAKHPCSFITSLCSEIMKWYVCNSKWIFSKRKIAQLWIPIIAGWWQLLQGLKELLLQLCFIHFQALCHFQGLYGRKHLLLCLKSTNL